MSGKHSKVIDSVRLSSRDSRIEVKFNTEYVGTKEIDFDFDVYLTIAGRRQSDSAISFSGSFENEVIEIHGDAGSIDISDGCIAEAQESISKLDVEIGNGVVVETRMSKGKRIYGMATHTPDSSDDEIMKEYRDISDVVSLHTIGLNSASSVVKLGSEYRNNFVYDKGLAYLGKGNEKLSYSDKYYLSSKELDIADKNVVPEPSVERATQVPTSTESPSNVNDNPGTGR